MRAVAALYLPRSPLDLPYISPISPYISPTKVRAVAALDELAAGATPAVRELPCCISRGGGRRAVSAARDSA